MKTLARNHQQSTTERSTQCTLGQGPGLENSVQLGLLGQAKSEMLEYLVK